MQIFSPNHFNQLPDAILFDIDNTFYSYEEPHKVALEAVKDKTMKTFSIESNKFDEAFFEARSSVKRRLANVASSHSRLLYMQKTLEILGLGSQILNVLDLEQTYWRVFLRNAELFENVKELLDDIRLLDIPTAVVTDLTAQIQFRKMVYFGLDQYFDFIVTSEEAGKEKPDKEPFKIALQKINPVGSCVWMIGDHPDKDILGSKETIDAVTLQKIHKGVIRGEKENKADLIFNNYAEIRKLISELKEK